MFNATFNNSSVISWRSVLLVEETRVPVENYWLVAYHWQTLSHNIVHNPCEHSRSLRFSQFSGCWLIVSVYIITSLDFPFVRLFGNFVITFIGHETTIYRIRGEYANHGSKVPVVTVTVFKYRNKIGKIFVKAVPYSVT
jgi:hypothetical protein